MLVSPCYTVDSILETSANVLYPDPLKKIHSKIIEYITMRLFSVYYIYNVILVLIV